MWHILVEFPKNILPCLSIEWKDATYTILRISILSISNNLQAEKQAVLNLERICSICSFLQLHWLSIWIPQNFEGTLKWHHIPFLHSVSRFSSQLSRSLYLCLADKTALLNTPAVKTHAESHDHRLGELTNGRQI